MKRVFLTLFVLVTAYSAHSQWGPYILDTITFEEPYEYLQIDTLSGNIWQIGEPGKQVFNSAFSLPNAIVTDTIETYPAGNHSRFILKIGEFNYEYYYPYDIFMEITHKYHTDTLLDGGYITVSYDYGQTWMNIIEDTVYEEMTPRDVNENLYTTDNILFNGEYGFSGNSGGWITTMFAWHYIPVDNPVYPGDTMFIGFNFISDSLETFKDGWMIDNIVLYAEDLGGSVREMNRKDMQLYPNPARDRVFIKYGNMPFESKVRIYDLLGRAVIESKIIDNYIDISNLKNGIYILSILTEEGVLRKKFLVGD